MVRPSGHSSKWTGADKEIGCAWQTCEYHDAPMHNRFDQYTKNLLREALSYVSKQTETEVEVIAATQKIDVFAVPDPERIEERKSLGLLGELSTAPTMFELFSTTLNVARFRLCLKKQLSWHSELERRARVATRKAEAAETEETLESSEVVVFPRLLIVSPGRPDSVLEKFGARPVCPGVYDLVEGLSVYIIVLSELQRTRETLLLRLMGRDRVFVEALEDLKKLPPDAQEGCVVSPLLVHFHFEVQDPAPDEQPMSAEIRAWYQAFVEDQQRKERELREAAVKEALDKGERQGISQGISQGVTKGERALLLRQLRARFGNLPVAAIARIEAADVTLVECWGERVLSAQTLADVFDDLN
jgi:hypothetical protein